MTTPGIPASTPGISGANAVGAPAAALPRRGAAFFNRLRWMWQLHFGTPAWLAIGLLIGAAALYAVWLPRLHEEHAQTQRLAERLAKERRAASAQAAAQAKEPGVSPSAQEWLNELPTTDQRSLLVGRMLAAAKQSGVVLERADYTAQNDANLPLSKLNAAVPVVGTYGEIRRFIAEVLNGMPQSALESLQLERPDTQTTRLRATAQFVLMFRREAP